MQKQQTLAKYMGAVGWGYAGVTCLCGGWVRRLSFKLRYELTDLCSRFTADTQASFCAIKGVEENGLNGKYQSFATNMLLSIGTNATALMWS